MIRSGNKLQQLVGDSATTENKTHDFRDDEELAAPFGESLAKP